MQDELIHRRKQWMLLGYATALTLPGVLARFEVFNLSTELDTILYGLAILGAAFLLSWGAEVAQMDISKGLAIAFLAFIAVLPEYAVDLVFSWKAGQQDRAEGLKSMLCGDQERCSQLAIANMTGANRLLIGLGWAAVVLVWWRRSKQTEVRLGEARRTDLGFLILATTWAMTIPLRKHLSLVDLVVLLTLFGLYLWHVSKEEQEHPELIGPPLAIAALGKRGRRITTVGLFIFAAAVILAVAEPFAHGLTETGSKFGISSFLLVQWLAPLASEAPEMIIAILFVLRSKPEQGLGALVSSKVNQWTLLVGTVPLVYAISYGSATQPLHLDPRQVEEVLLTAAQSLFACAVIANLKITKGEAITLLVLFLAQFGFENTQIRYGFAAMYILLFVILMVKDPEARRSTAASVRLALSRPGAKATSK